MFKQFVLHTMVFCMCVGVAVGSTVSCSFDSGLCGWHRVGSSSFQWRNTSGPSPDRTSGPLNDHTCNNFKGQYLFASGSEAQSSDDVAILESENIDATDASEFQFWYLMDGIGVGNLSVAIVTENGDETVVWSVEGRQDRRWKRASVHLSKGNVTIRLSATVKLPYGSDLAIDDMRLKSEEFSENTSHCTLPSTTTVSTTTTKATTRKTTHTTTPKTYPTTHIPSRSTFASTKASNKVTFKQSTTTARPPPVQCSIELQLPWSCDFNDGLCCMNVIPSSSGPVITWERIKQIAGKQYKDVITGDHSGAGQFIHFILHGFSFFAKPETSSFETPFINSSIINFTFWYNMPANYSNLELFVKGDNGTRQIWRGSQATPGWHKKTLSIFEDQPFQLVFQVLENAGISKVGLDDFSIVEIPPTTKTSRLPTLPTAKTTAYVGNTSTISQKPISTLMPSTTVRITSLTSTSTMVSEISKTPSKSTVSTLRTNPPITVITNSSLSKATTRTVKYSTNPKTSITTDISSRSTGAKTTATKVTITRSTTTTRPPQLQCSVDLKLPWSCDFNDELCCMNAIPSQAGTLITWDRTNQEQGSKYTGLITGDHSGDGQYIYFHLYGLSFLAQPASSSFETPIINSRGINFTFWYNMPANYSNLEVFVKSGNGTRQIWRGSKASPGWHQATLSVFEDNSFKIVFQVLKNVGISVVGLDDFSIVDISKPPITSRPPTLPTANPASASVGNTSTVSTATTLETNPTITVTNISQTTRLSSNSTPTITTTEKTIASTGSGLTPGHEMTTKHVTKKPNPIDEKKPVSKANTGDKAKLRNIVGCSVGGVAVLAVVAVIIYVAYMRMRRKPSYKSSNMEGSEIDIGISNSKVNGNKHSSYGQALYDSVRINKPSVVNGNLTNGHASTHNTNGNLFDPSTYDESTHL